MIDGWAKRAWAHGDRRFLLTAAGLLGWVTWAYLRSAAILPLLPRGVAYGPAYTKVYDRAAFVHLAYSDILSLYSARGLYLHALPYLTVRIEYPVIMGWFMWLTALAPGIRAYFALSALALGAAALATLVLMRRLAPNHYQYFAWSPLLLPYSLLNWDLLAILGMTLAWYAFRSERAGLTGIWLALGVSTKLFPIIGWPFMAVAWWRRGLRRQSLVMTATMLAGCLVLNLPMALANFHNWSYFVTFNAHRQPGADLWTLWGSRLNVRAVNLLSFVLVFGGAVLLAARVWRGDSPEKAAALEFALFFLVNKVFSPQYMLWMLAAGVLAEWPGWTTWLVAVGGWVDYWNSFTLLSHHMVNVSTRRGAAVAVPDVNFLVGLAIRYASIAGAALGSIVADTGQAAGTGAQTARHPSRDDRANLPGSDEMGITL
jgi:hypothetical protein